MRMSHQKGFGLIHLLGAIVIASLIGGVLYLGKTNNINTYQAPPQSENALSQRVMAPTPTPDPTANWQVYTNQKYGYSVKYPNDLKTNEFETSFAHIAEFTLGRDAAGNVSFATYTITVAKDTFNAKDAASVNFLTADWVNSFFTMKVGDTKKAGSITFKKLPTEKLAGQDAAVIQVDSTNTQKRYFLKNSGYVYMIYDNDNPSTYPLFLSTFHFTN
jgi:hypothetical protein